MNVLRPVRFLSLMAGVFAAALLVVPQLAQSQKQALPRSVNFGTHVVGTVFNAVGTGLANVATERGSIRVVVQPFAGPPAWIPTMNREGKPEIGIINVSEAWQAFTGKATPEALPAGAPQVKTKYSPNSNLRMLMMGTNLAVGMPVRADSPVKSMADMKGKSVTWDYPAFPAGILAGLSMFATCGISVQDVKTVPVPEVVAGVRAVMEGRADAAATAAVGMGIVTEADAKVGIRFLPVCDDPKGVRVAQGIMPGGHVGIRRAGPAGLKQDTLLWQYGIVVAASTHMPNEVAYALVKTWADNWKQLEPIHPQLRGWRPEVFVQKLATIPYHPGAINFYKERGLWNSEMDRNQEILLKGELPFLN
ncbi:MAG TPA: TAXI family TRAP transporter solute-binding subunit [Candidatus Binatia bacterium]|nr:TAXI family TRAP transporter solute-binding subunit [Candidatus Binatia bacterium]